MDSGRRQVVSHIRLSDSFLVGNSEDPGRLLGTSGAIVATESGITTQMEWEASECRMTWGGDGLEDTEECGTATWALMGF